MELLLPKCGAISTETYNHFHDTEPVFLGNIMAFLKLGVDALLQKQYFTGLLHYKANSIRHVFQRQKQLRLLRNVEAFCRLPQLHIRSWASSERDSSPQYVVVYSMVHVEVVCVAADLSDRSVGDTRLWSTPSHFGVILVVPPTRVRACERL